MYKKTEWKEEFMNVSIYEWIKRQINESTKDRLSEQLSELTN